MRLIELSPLWIHPNIFTFICPHCRKIFLSCKNIIMRITEQYRIFTETLAGGDEDYAHKNIITCKYECAWNISSSDFASLSVTPSIDASASGHWHGIISNGVCTP